jgi:hypothetical protein
MDSSKNMLIMLGKSVRMSRRILSNSDGSSGFEHRGLLETVELAQFLDGGAVTLGYTAEGVASTHFIIFTTLAVVAHRRSATGIVGIARFGHFVEGVLVERDGGGQKGAGFAANDILGIDGVALISNFEVEVAASRAACIAAKAYLLTSLDAGAWSDMTLG